MPVVMLRAHDLGITGYETPTALEANVNLKQQLEQIRLRAGAMMNLGDVSTKTVPKMCLVSAPERGGMINTRTFIPHTVHEAIGVLGAISTATACLLPGSVTEGIAVMPLKADLGYAVEHPAGEFTVMLEQEHDNDLLQFRKSGVIRTARLLCKGDVLVPL